jgi:hypothetical protein
MAPLPAARWCQMVSDGRNGAKFTRKEEAIAALLTQRNLEEAARVTGIGTQTLLRWLELPEKTIVRPAVRPSINRLHGCSKPPALWPQSS